MTTLIAFIGGCFLSFRNSLALITVLSLLDIIICSKLIGVLNSLIDAFDKANLEMIEYGDVNGCSDGPLQRVFKMIGAEKNKSIKMVSSCAIQYYILIVAFVIVGGMSIYFLVK